MKHPIDPKVDCVFKALLGSEENSNLLIHFLNAVLGHALGAPIVEVEILNPYNEREFLGDKLSVVDVKAKDGRERQFQVEIQLEVHAHLLRRIAYAWCDLHASQLRAGQDYRLLRPTYAIWLLAGSLFKDDARHARDFRLRDARGAALEGEGGIWLLELGKFRAGQVESDDQRWVKFFRDGGDLDDGALPDWMDTPEMRQAMSTLKRFSEKERDYHLYQARMNYLREQSAIRGDMEELAQNLAEARRLADEARCLADEALRREAQERAAREREQAEKERALAEVERMKALLAGKAPPP
jgi:predicted transposase/invertase (TIGR01784 family)